MFWNDPNLYSVAFKDGPNFPQPFWGQIPRHFNPYFAPYVNPQMFTPPVTPFTPLMQTTPTFPWIDRTMTPYNYNVPNFPTVPNYLLPYFQGYRPFGL